MQERLSQLDAALQSAGQGLDAVARARRQPEPLSIAPLRSRSRAPEIPYR